MSTLVKSYNLARTSEAWFSPDELYRYYLRHSFFGAVDAAPVSPVVFGMLNPSTATAFVPDPTITRCMNFARAWGFTDLIVVNLFAIRETNSALLKDFADPVGPANDEVIASLPRCKLVAAWGAHPMAAERARDVLSILGKDRVFCLRKTKDGAPGHPLYLPKHLTPIPYEAE